MFTMQYSTNNVDNTTTTATISIENEDITLGQLFGHFLKMTEIMGYQAESWNKIIDEAYGCCVIHATAPESYDMFEFGLDSTSV